MTRVNNFVENGGRLCRTLARSVSVDVDPNAPKKNQKFSVFFREVSPGSPSPRKPHIKVGSLANTGPLSQQACRGGFGVPWAHSPAAWGATLIKNHSRIDFHHFGGMLDHF